MYILLLYICLCLLLAENMVLMSVSGGSAPSIRSVPGGLRAKTLWDPGPNIDIDPHRACLHAMRFLRGCCDFRSLHFTYLLDGCLFDDDLPIANLEPGVSGRNSLPLPGTPGPWAPAGA